MAKKKASKAGQANVSSQHADSKGLNAKRDANRGTGPANVTMTKGQGTRSFRKIRSGGD
jgi:hypothetical protein